MLLSNTPFVSCFFTATFFLWKSSRTGDEGLEKACALRWSYCEQVELEGKQLCQTLEENLHR